MIPKTPTLRSSTCPSCWLTTSAPLHMSLTLGLWPSACVMIDRILTSCHNPSRFCLCPVSRRIIYAVRKMALTSFSSIAYDFSRGLSNLWHVRVAFWGFCPIPSCKMDSTCYPVITVNLEPILCLWLLLFHHYISPDRIAPTSLPTNDILHLDAQPRMPNNFLQFLAGTLLNKLNAAFEARRRKPSCTGDPTFIISSNASDWCRRAAMRERKKKDHRREQLWRSSATARRLPLPVRWFLISCGQGAIFLLCSWWAPYNEHASCHMAAWEGGAVTVSFASSDNDQSMMASHAVEGISWRFAYLAQGRRARSLQPWTWLHAWTWFTMEVLVEE